MDHTNSAKAVDDVNEIGTIFRNCADWWIPDTSGSCRSGSCEGRHKSPNLQTGSRTAQAE